MFITTAWDWIHFHNWLNWRWGWTSPATGEVSWALAIPPAKELKFYQEQREMGILSGDHQSIPGKTPQHPKSTPGEWRDHCEKGGTDTQRPVLVFRRTNLMEMELSGTEGPCRLCTGKWNIALSLVPALSHGSHSIAAGFCPQSPWILSRLEPQASPFQGPEQHSSLRKSWKGKILFHFLIVFSVCALPLAQAEHLGPAQRSHSLWSGGSALKWDREI